MNKSIKHNLVCKRMNQIQNYAKSYLPDFVCFSRERERESIGYYLRFNSFFSDTNN
jgi:hypothetical protein